MSSLKTNEEISKAKSVTSSGDGVKLREKRPHQNYTPRTPVPSCRRFNASSRYVENKANTKITTELQRAIKELAHNSKITRRKSLTMSEITPTRTVEAQTPKKENQSRSTTNVQEAGETLVASSSTSTTATPPSSAPCKEVYAGPGRLVFQTLLLNAWRRRRTEAKSVNESCQELQAQIRTMRIQNSVLRSLQRGEFKKCMQAVAEIQHLSKQIQELAKKEDTLIQEKKVLEEKIKTLEDQVEGLNIATQNTHNDLVTSQNTLQEMERQLEAKTAKIKTVKNENDSLLQQLSRTDSDIEVLNSSILDLHEKLANAESENQDSKRKLLDINRSFEEESNKNKEFQTVLIAFELKIEELNASLSKSEHENQSLKKDLAQVETLKLKRQELWWINLKTLGMALICEAVHMLLP